MRVVRAASAVAAAVVALVAAPSADSKPAQDHPSSWDLLCREVRIDGGVDWAAWWAANRAVILKPSFRAAVGKPIDPVARSRARDALLAELKSKESLVASEAALALGRAGDARDIATLAKIVSDGETGHDRRLHGLAAIGLGLLPAGDAGQSAEARRALLAGVESARGERDEFVFFWSNCAYALAMRGDAGVVPRLAELRKAGGRGASAKSAITGEVLGPMGYALGVLGGADVAPELQEEARSAPPKDVSLDFRWHACHALARIAGDSTKKALLGAAKDEREWLRRVALGALGAAADSKDDGVAAELRTAMTGEYDPTCRQVAGISLGRTAHATSADALLKAWSSTKGRDARDKFSRGAFALGLGLCARAKPDARISDALAKALSESSSQDEQAALALACGLAGVQSARARIAELVDKGKSDVLGPTAASALALLGAGPEEKKALHEAVAQSTFASLRGEAALALGALHDHTVVDQLRAIVSAKKTRDIDRATAAACLGYVGDDADIDFMIAAIAEAGSVGQVRACIVHALGRLLDQRENAPLGRVAADSMWFLGPGDPLPGAIVDIQRLAD